MCIGKGCHIAKYHCAYSLFSLLKRLPNAILLLFIRCFFVNDLLLIFFNY